MDFRHLKDHHDELFNLMGKNGYSENYIFSIRKVINFIFSHAENNTWTSYRDVYNDIAHGALPVSLSKFNLKRMSVALTVLEQFDVFGRLPGDGERHSLFKRRAYFCLEGEFKELIDFFAPLKGRKGRKAKQQSILSNLAPPTFLTICREKELRNSKILLRPLFYPILFLTPERCLEETAPKVISSKCLPLESIGMSRFAGPFWLFYRDCGTQERTFNT